MAKTDKRISRTKRTEKSAPQTRHVKKKSESGAQAARGTRRSTTSSTASAAPHTRRVKIKSAAAAKSKKGDRRGTAGATARSAARRTARSTRRGATAQRTTRSTRRATARRTARSTRRATEQRTTAQRTARSARRAAAQHPAHDAALDTKDTALPSPSTLSVKGLHKSYGRKHVVKGVDFSIDQGRVIGFLGPNGAGKTTIFHMLVGFIRADSGIIYLDGKNIGKHPMYRRALMGITYLPQESSIFRKLSVAQNIMAVLQTRNDLNRAGRRELLDTLLERFGITEVRNQRADTLSGGERRRAEIARALAINPKFLLLDEPFTGIDPIAVGEIKTIVYDLSRLGIGVLITDHNARDTLDITDAAYIISEGVIIASGSRQDIIRNQKAKEAYFGATFDSMEM